MAKKRKPRRQIRTISMTRCDGTRFHFDQPFGPGEVRELLTSYRKPPRSPRAVCNISIFGQKKPIAEYSRFLGPDQWTRVRLSRFGPDAKPRRRG